MSVWQANPAQGMDLEQRITFETNQRLERMMGDREAFMQNDLDGNGMVDSEEWDQARARVEAEVRAELAGESAEAPEPAAAREVAAEEPSRDEDPVQDQAW